MNSKRYNSFTACKQLLPVSKLVVPLTEGQREQYRSLLCSTSPEKEVTNLLYRCCQLNFSKEQTRGNSDSTASSHLPLLSLSISVLRPSLALNNKCRYLEQRLSKRGARAGKTKGTLILTSDLVVARYVQQCLAIDTFVDFSTSEAAALDKQGVQLFHMPRGSSTTIPMSCFRKIFVYEGLFLFDSGGCEPEQPEARSADADQIMPHCPRKRRRRDSTAGVPAVSHILAQHTIEETLFDNLVDFSEKISQL